MLDFLTDNGSEDKKAKDTKKCLIKRNLKFENYKNYFDATQIETKTNYLEKNKIDLDSIKEFIKHKKPILKIQQRFKSESYNVFTEEINKITLSSNDDKRIQSIDSIETYAFETSKGLAINKEEIKCDNIIKRYKK